MPLVGKSSTSIRGKFFPPYEPSKILFLKKPPPSPTLPNQRFGREPGHSLPQEVGEEKGKTSMLAIPECFYYLLSRHS